MYLWVATNAYDKQYKRGLSWATGSGSEMPVDYDNDVHNKKVTCEMTSKRDTTQ